MEREGNIVEDERAAVGGSPASVEASCSSSSSLIPISSMGSIASNNHFQQVCNNFGNFATSNEEDSEDDAQSEVGDSRDSSLRIIPGTTNFRFQSGIVAEPTSEGNTTRWWMSLGQSPTTSPSASSSSTASALSGYQNRIASGGIEVHSMSDSEEDQSSLAEYAETHINGSEARQMSEQAAYVDSSVILTNRSQRHQRSIDSYSDGDYYSNSDTEELMTRLIPIRIPHRGNSVSDCSQCSAYSDDDDAEPDPLTKWLYPV